MLNALWTGLFEKSRFVKFHNADHTQFKHLLSSVRAFESFCIIKKYFRFSSVNVFTALTTIWRKKSWLEAINDSMPFYTHNTDTRNALNKSCSNTNKPDQIGCEWAKWKNVSSKQHDSTASIYIKIKVEQICRMSRNRCNIVFLTRQNDTL